MLVVMEAELHVHQASEAFAGYYTDLLGHKDGNLTSGTLGDLTSCCKELLKRELLRLKPERPATGPTAHEFCSFPPHLPPRTSDINGRALPSF